MWIVCAGMRRSASTLLYQITERLVEDTGRGQGIGATEDYGNIAEVNGQRSYKSGDLVIKTHEYDAFWRGEKVLYVYRNLFDVLVSASFNDSTVNLNNEQSIMDRARWLVEQHTRWMQCENMLVLTYGELAGSTVQAVRKIADHLAIPVSQRWCTQIAWAYSVPQQKARSKGDAWRIRDRIRDGRIGMWRDYVNDEQARVLMAVVEAVAPDELRQ